MGKRPTAESWHRKRHDRGRDRGASVEDCWQCGRDRAVCRTKIAFISWVEADEWVAEFNRTHRYADAVVRYPCRWCPNWHMSTARTRIQLHRVERARRKQLVRNRGEERQ